MLLPTPSLTSLTMPITPPTSSCPITRVMGFLNWLCDPFSLTRATCMVTVLEFRLRLVGSGLKALTPSP